MKFYNYFLVVCASLAVAFTVLADASEATTKTTAYTGDDDDVDYLGGYNRTLDWNDDDDEAETRTNVYSESNENKQMRMRPTYYASQPPPPPSPHRPPLSSAPSRMSSSRKLENFDSKFSDYVNDFKKYRQAMSTNANYDDRRSQAGKSENANNELRQNDNEMKTTSGRYPLQMPHYNNNPYSYGQPLPQQQQQQYQHQMPSYPGMNPSNQYGAPPHPPPPPPHHPPQYQRPNYPTNNQNNQNDALMKRREHEFFILGNEIDFIIWLLQRLFEKKVRDDRTRMYLSSKLREMLAYWESTNFGA